MTTSEKKVAPRNPFEIEPALRSLANETGRIGDILERLVKATNAVADAACEIQTHGIELELESMAKGLPKNWERLDGVEMILREILRELKERNRR